MAYGLQAFNSNGEFLLTDTYVKPWFMAKGTVSGVIGPYQIDFEESTDGGSTYTQKNFRAYTVNYTIPNHNAITKTGYAAITLPNTNIFYSPQIYWQSGSGFSIDVLVPTNITATASDTPEVYLFCIENINAYSTSGYGLQIFNSSSQCMYDSNYQAFRPIYAIGGGTPFPYFGSPFIGSNPKIGNIITGTNTYDFSPFSAITKPIYVLPPFTYYIQVKEQTDPIYSIASGDPYWQYTFKTFYSRSSNNTITSKAYYNQSFYEPEASSGQAWASYGNAQNYVIISDGSRYSTSGGGTFPNATYNLSVSPASPVEGTNFTITLTTTNIPNGTTFNWTLSGDTLTGTDFSGNYSSGTMTVQSNSSTVTFTPLIDADTGTEQYTFELFDSNGLVIKSLSFTVGNTAATSTYSLSRTPATGNVNEGDSFTVTVSTTSVSPGTVLSYTVGSNFDSLDGTNLHLSGSFPGLTGTFQSASASKTFITTADNRTDGFKTFTLTLSHGSNPSISIGVNDSSQATGNGDMLNLSTATPNRNEGQSATVVGNWNFGTYNYDGRTFKLQIASNSVANASDVTITPSGFVSVIDVYGGGELLAQRRNWTVAIVEDLTTETATEALVLEAVDSSGYVYHTQTITISDTSKTPGASVEFYSSSPAVDSGTGLIYLNETTTKTLSLTVTVTHTVDNIPIYWKTTGTGNFTIGDVDTALNGTIYTVVGAIQRTLPDITIKTDYTTEITAESFVIGFYSDSAYTNLLYEAPIVSVNDTSQTPTLNISNVSITPAPVSEGNTVTCVFTIQDSTVQTVYFKIVGGTGFTSSDVASYTPANNSITTATGAGEQRTITVTLSADQTTEGTEQFYIYFFTSATWNSGNPVDANKWGQIGPISVSDTSTTPPVRTFLPSVAAVNEGQTFNITFTTNQAGSFAYTITGVTSSDISGAALTGTVTNNSVLSYTATNDNTAEGDETFVITLDAYPTVTANVLIKDTSIPAPPSADSIALNTLGKPLNMAGLVYVYNNVYWVTWTLSSATEIVFSTEHELPIATNGTDTTIAIYDSNSTLMHTSGLGDDLGVNGRGVDYSSRITMTLGAGTYYGAVAVYSSGYQFLNGYNTTNFSQTALVNNASNIRISLWTGTPDPQLQDVTIPSSVNEGDTATFSFTLLDTLDRSIFYRLVFNTATSADFTTATSGSWFNSWPRSTQNLTVTTNADALTEATAESFYWQLSTSNAFTTVFYTSSTVTINDTSQTVVPTWSFGAPPGNLSEGIQYAIEFTSTNWNGNIAYFSIQSPNNGGTAATSSDLSITASLTVNSNSYSGYVYINVTQDYTAEGDEWFRVRANNASGTQLAISDNIKIVSHSAPNYTITNLSGSMNEGTAYTGTFTAYNIRNTAFTLQVAAPSSGTAATSSEITISPSSLTTSSDSDTSAHQFTVTPTSDGVVETNEYFRIGAYIGTSLATQTGDILIPGTASAPTGTFSVSPASHTGYANIAASWSISGNPVPVVNITGSNGFEFNNAGTTGSGYILEYSVGEDVTYTLTATNSVNTLTLTSSSLVPAVSVSLSASPSTITSGQSTTLTYSTTNATSAQISPGVGALSPVSSGSVVVSPTTTTTYTLGANNVQKVAQTTATVTVNPAAPDISSVSVSPNPTVAATGTTVPYTITVNLTSAVSSATGVDITLAGSNGFDGTYTNFITIAAGASSGTYNGTLGTEQGDRNVTVTASKTGVFASSANTTWNIDPPPPAGGSMTVTGSSSWNYSGGLTSASPLTGTSSNSSQNSTTAYINFIVQNGGGTVYYNISSSSEANYDFARIRKNGVVQAERSGLNQNMSGSFAVIASNTVVVEYSKDGSVNSGTDNATINSLYFVPS